MDDLIQLVGRWDFELLSEKSSSKSGNVPIGGHFREQLDFIETLARFKYVPYLNDELQDFPAKLWSWLEQFETGEEKKLAIRVASSITAFTEEQIRYLQEVCYKEKLVYRLLERIIARQKLPPYSYDRALGGFDEELQRCLVVPLTDSARYNQFVHVNDLENHSKLGLGTLDVFVHPDIRNTPQAVEKLRDRYKDKEVLVVIEDFCGSGRTFTSDLARLAELYDFETVYFCPYIITQRAESAIYRFARRYASRVSVEILFGLKLSERMRVFSPVSSLFSYEEKKALMTLCIKYHQQYFRSNRFIGTPRSYPFGYRDGQLLVVFQSNCPNHTLPIVWAHDNGWEPLFRRVQRYA